VWHQCFAIGTPGRPEKQDNRLPENLKNSMSDRWRQKVRNREILEEQKKQE